MDILYGPDFFINEPTVVTIGKFDGLHDGHKKIIKTLCFEAKKNNLKSVVYTFNTNPKIVLNLENFVPLMNNDEKSLAIKKLNVNYLVYEDFNFEFSKMEPEEFVKNVLVEKMNVKCVVMGENSSFGKDGIGKVNDMKLFGNKYGFKVEVVPLIKVNGEILSSSLLRKIPSGKF